MNKGLTTMFYKGLKDASVLRMGSEAKDSLRNIAFFNLYERWHCSIIVGK